MKQSIAFFQLMRWVNIAMIALAQCLIVYAFGCEYISKYNYGIALFILLLVGTCSIAICGNLVNALTDQKADTINKPKRVNALLVIGEKNIKRACYFFYAIGMACGIGLSIFTKNISYATTFAGIAFLLWLYSHCLKGIFLIGNIVVSLLVAMSLFIPFWFLHGSEKIQFQNESTQLFLAYLFFSFMVNLIREITKDAEDVVGDFASKHKTLPILLGKKRTNQIIQTLVFITQLSLVWVYFHFFNGQWFQLIYIFFILIGLGLFIFFKVGKARNKKAYAKLSLMLKVWMFLGIITLVFISFY